MRSDDMRKNPTLKRHGAGMASQEIVSAKHKRRTYTLSAQIVSALKAISIYKRFNFGTSARGLHVKGWFWNSILQTACFQDFFFPESVWAQGSSNSGGLYLIFSSSHLHIFTSSHLHIFSPSHLHISSSSHLLIFTSSHLHIFTSSHLHILTSSHLLIFTSSHLHICSSSHQLIFTSSHPHICSSPHPHIFTSSPLALSFFSISLLKARGSANATARNATLSHEARFDRQKLN